MAFKELTPEEWLDEIDYGLEYRKRFGLEDMWGQLEAIYYNVHDSMMNDGPNILLSQGDSMLSTVTVPSPRIRVVPRRPEAVSKAPLVESVDNTILRDINLVEEAERCALHTYLYGRGFLKVGYDSEWGYDPSLDVGGNLRLGLTLTQLNEKGTRRIEYDQTVVPGMPWVRAVLPHDIVVPWGTRDVNSLPWIAHRVVRHVDDLRADSKYSRTQRIEPQISMRDFVDSYRNTMKLTRSGGSTRKAEYVELWEIHDRRTGRIYAIVSDHPHFLRRDFNALQINNRLPFTSMSFTPTARALWTTPDVFYLYHIQAELSDVARQRTKQRRLATLKFIYDGDAITDEELAKLLSPDVGAAAKMESGRKLNEAIVRLDNQVNQTLALEEEHLRQNAREQIGFSRNQIGEYSGGRKTATEASIVDRSSQLRMSRRGLAVKRLYEDTIAVVNDVIFTHWTLPRYVEVLGMTKANQWQQVSGPMLSDRYSYEVTLVDEAETRAEKFEALQLYAMLAQDPAVDPVALREFLINANNDPAFERIFNADIQLGLSLLRRAGGVVQQDNGRTSAPMRALPGRNGQATNGRARSTMASGRSRS